MSENNNDKKNNINKYNKINNKNNSKKNNNLIKNNIKSNSISTLNKEKNILTDRKNKIYLMIKKLEKEIETLLAMNKNIKETYYIYPSKINKEKIEKIKNTIKEYREHIKRLKIKTHEIELEIANVNRKKTNIEMIELNIIPSSKI